MKRKHYSISSINNYINLPITNSNKTIQFKSTVATNKLIDDQRREYNPKSIDVRKYIQTYYRGQH